MGNDKECYWDGRSVGTNLTCHCGNDKPTFYDGQWWFLCRQNGIIFGNQRPVLRLRDI